VRLWGTRSEGWPPPGGTTWRRRGGDGRVTATAGRPAIAERACAALALALLGAAVAASVAGAIVN